jgi:hypothetical protein
MHFSQMNVHLQLACVLPFVPAFIHFDKHLLSQSSLQALLLGQSTKG